MSLKQKKERRKNTMTEGIPSWEFEEGKVGILRKEHLHREVKMTPRWRRGSAQAPATAAAADRRSQAAAPAPVSWAARRGAIDNTSACKVEAIPPGAFGNEWMKSPRSLFRLRG